MVDIVKNNLERIREACKKHKVKSLYVFGSAAEGSTFNEESDIDVLYKIDLENFKDWDTADYDYLDNLLDLEKLLAKILHRKIDLIQDKDFENKYFKRSIERNKQIVYAA